MGTLKQVSSNIHSQNLWKLLSGANTVQIIVWSIEMGDCLDYLSWFCAWNRQRKACPQRRPCDHGVKSWCGIVRRQGMLGTTGRQKRQGESSLLELSLDMWPCQHFGALKLPGNEFLPSPAVSFVVIWHRKVAYNSAGGWEWGLSSFLQLFIVDTLVPGTAPNSFF